MSEVIASTGEVVVASYNMSFAADLGAIMGSEKHNIQNNSVQNQDDIRKGWKDSKQLVLKFLSENPTCVIGMQEMNQRDKVNNSDYQLFVSENGGLESIIESLDKSKFNSYNAGVEGAFNSYPSLLTIWSKTLGEKSGDAQVFDLCVEHNNNYDKYSELIKGQLKSLDVSEYKTVNEKSGRPITIVRTDKGYTFINLHGINKNGHSEYYTKFTEIFIQEQIDKSIDLDKLFIMGDFNDPYNKLKNLTLNEQSFGYGDEAPKSCCYNFNSSCKQDLKDLGQALISAEHPESVPVYSESTNTDTKHIDLWNAYKENYQNLDTNKDKFKIEVYKNQCPVLMLKSPPPAENKELLMNMDESVGQNSAARSIGDRGNVNNYQFTGDYVFGLNVKTPIQIYEKPENFGFKSDHEMVFAIFTNGKKEGGKSKRKTKRKQRRSRKQKKSRKHRK